LFYCCLPKDLFYGISPEEAIPGCCRAKHRAKIIGQKLGIYVSFTPAHI
jgi:hypothetical protein